MARPKRKGLDYFPMDIDIFEEEKLFDVQNQYGPIGEVVYIRLLCLIYKNGYYYPFEDLDRLSALLVKSIGNRWVNDKKEVREIIGFLVECGLFSEEMMQKKVLTSHGIQRRFWSATERRHSLRVEEYSLIDDIIENEKVVQSSKDTVRNEVVVCDNSENADNGTQSKAEESRVKESKAEQSESRVEEKRAEKNCTDNTAQLTTTTHGTVELRIPCLDKGKIYPVTTPVLQKLQTIYPNVDVRQSLTHLSRYLINNAPKRRRYDEMQSYCEMWIQGDEEQGKCRRIADVQPSYDLEAYENADPFEGMDFDENGNITNFSEVCQRRR